jgi:hypothetical protein
MNALTTTPNSLPDRPTMPPLSKALSELLDATGSPDDACRAIIADAGLLDEARAALPALKAVAEAKAGRDGVMAVISRRLVTYPQPQRSAEEWEAWWADYFDALGHVPLASLEAGMRAYVADPASEFMPKPGKLRELAFTAPCRSLGRYYRAKRAVQLSEETPALSGPRVDPADVREALADFRGKLVSVSAAKPALPSIAGKLAEGRAITREMAALMARRAAEQ